jgi:long-chain acyl-CoA synthetase
VPTRDNDGAVLLTGATGFLGMELLARYLERTDRRVYALVRAGDRNEAAARMRAARRWLFGAEGAHAGRVIAVPADLTVAGLGLSRDARKEIAAEVTDVVHGAASVSFEQPLAEAREINLRGTQRVLELCEQLAAPRSVSYISTAYVAGDHAGVFGEDDLDVGQSFRNTYEQSKYEAEQLVRSYAGVLPLRVLRPSIIVGDRASGWTASFNVLYWPVRAFARSGYVALPARRDAPVDAVSVDYVADAVFALDAAPGPDVETYHLTAGAATSTVGEVVELSARRFGRRPPYLLGPALYRRLVHPLLVWRAGSERRRLLRRTETYFPYFSVAATYDDSRSRAALEPLGIRPAPLRDYFGRLVDFALAAEWGRKQLPQARWQAPAPQRSPSDARAARLNAEPALSGP